MLRLKKWALWGAVAVQAALVGCGGSGHSSSTSTTSTGPGTSTGRPTALQVGSWNTGNALVYVSFLTGAARAATDKFMTIENASIQDSLNNVSAVRPSYSPLTLDLSQYQIQFATIDVLMAPTVTGAYNQNSELFDHFTLNPFSFIDPNSAEFGNAPPSNTVNPNPVVAETPFPCRVRTFPGRDSILPVFLNDAMFVYNPSTDTEDPTFTDPTNTSSPWLIQSINEAPNSNPNTSGKMVGYLSDFVQFNIGSKAWKGVPVKLIDPGGSDAGKTATHFYLSGDNYALSDDPVNASTGDASGSAGGVFEQLTFDSTNPLDGYMGQANVPPPAGTNTPFPTTNFPGTYNLLQTNPMDLTGATQITSIYGRWRNIENLSVMTNSTFDIIVFPNSDEAYNVNESADVVAIVHSGTSISNLYVGYAYFNGGLSGTNFTGAAYLYNLSDFQVGTTASQVVFGLNSFVTGSGSSTNFEPAIRSGGFTYQSSLSQPLPTGFTSTGTFVVFR